LHPVRKGAERTDRRIPRQRELHDDTAPIALRGRGDG
jgi:hypothetical protein